MLPFSVAALRERCFFVGFKQVSRVDGWLSFAYVAALWKYVCVFAKPQHKPLSLSWRQRRYDWWSSCFIWELSKPKSDSNFLQSLSVVGVARARRFDAFISNVARFVVLLSSAILCSVSWLVFILLDGFSLLSPELFSSSKQSHAMLVSVVSCSHTNHVSVNGL